MQIKQCFLSIVDLRMSLLRIKYVYVEIQQCVSFSIVEVKIFCIVCTSSATLRA